MMRALWLFAFLAAAGAMLLPPSEASAQWNNAPYQPSFRGAAGGVGMSPGYRQVMILDRLNSNISRNNYYRTPDGLLADITRRDGQAFPMSPEGFPLGPTRSVTQLSGLGYGGGGGGYFRGGSSTPFGGSLYASAAFNDWWPIVAGREGRGGGASLSSTPINSWIAQLDSL